MARRRPRWVLTLYVSGAAPRSTEAIEAVTRLCEGELAGQVDLRIVDVNDAPALVVEDQVLAVPTLVKRLPEPARRLVGSLADTGRLRAGLDLGPVGPAAPAAATAGAEPASSAEPATSAEPARPAGPGKPGPP